MDKTQGTLYLYAYVFGLGRTREILVDKEPECTESMARSIVAHHREQSPAGHDMSFRYVWRPDSVIL